MTLMSDFLLKYNFYLFFVKIKILLKENYSFY